MSRLAHAYGLSNVDDTRTLYDEWAITYDAEMAESGQDYVGPSLAAACAAKLAELSNKNIANVSILDAGCGTGLVGVQLAKLGARKIDGVDLSPGMLKIARDTGVYKLLEAADLTHPLVFQDNSFGVVVCIGTFTQGHVGPEAFSDFVRVTETGGFIVATVLGSIWEPQGYKAKVQELADTGKVEVISTELADYRRATSIQARMVLLRVLG